MTATLGFLVDDFTKRHLRGFFDAGRCPNDWTFDDLLAFEAWVEANGPDLYDDMGWPDLIRLYEAEVGR